MQSRSTRQVWILIKWLIGLSTLLAGRIAMREPALDERMHGSTELRRRQATARRLFGGPMQVERHPDDLPLNRRLVAATTERIRSALADLVAGAHEAWSAEPEGMVA